jgi:hypothetical protein
MEPRRNSASWCGNIIGCAPGYFSNVTAELRDDLDAICRI